MKELLTLLRSLHKDGKSPKAISDELFARGLKSEQGRFLTPEMVDSFLRLSGLEEGAGEPAKDKAGDQGDYSHIGPAICEKPYRAKGLREWPPGVDYGGENSYPDEPPYNFTHRPPCTGSHPWKSSAVLAVEGGF